MIPRRLAPALLATALALVPGVALAGIPAVIYPFRVPGLSAAQRADLHGILEAGLASASRRGILSLRSPALLPMVCGDRPASSCLAETAKGAVVLTGRGELHRGVVLVTATLCDPKGVRTREVRFLVDLVIQNLRPVNESIRELEIEIGPDGHVARDDRAVAAAKPPPPPAASSLSAKPPSLAAAPPAASPGAPAAASAKAAAPAAVQVVAPAPAPALWKRKAGPWLTGIGVALVAGGAAVGMMNRDLASDLDAKRATGSLTAEDRSSFDQVQTYNTLSTALFAAGGVAVASGAWIWITAPAAPGQPAAVGAGGRF